MYMYLPLFVGSFWYALLYVLSSFERKRKLVALLLLPFGYLLL